MGNVSDGKFLLFLLTARKIIVYVIINRVK